MLAEPLVRVAILGCGQIGSRWDMPGTPSAGGPTLTHAAAFGRLPGVQIVAFCDADLAKAQEAVAAWGCGTAFADAGAMFKAQAMDLAVIATHSSVRLGLVQQALAAGVRTLVIEKPLAGSLAESRQVVQALDECGARCLVNYLRHWDPALDDLRQRIASGEFGRVQRLIGLFGKGLSNSGSHMIDLAGLLCNARPVAARAWAAPLPASEADWSAGSDAVADGQVRLETADGHSVQLDLLATDTNAFTCFELKIIGTQAVCGIRLGGRSIELQTVQADANFAGYRVMGERQTLPARNLEAMDAMATEAVALARGQLRQARCDAHSALATAATVQALRESAAAGASAWQGIQFL
jgi:predicted dehydrogenase